MKKYAVGNNDVSLCELKSIQKAAEKALNSSV